MKRQFADFYAWLLGWPFLARANKALFYLSGRALGLYNYTSPRISGEQHAVRLGLAAKSAPVVFDVGANVGDWTAEVLGLRPDARIHAFEPQSRLAQGIAAAHAQVKVNAMALGEQPGQLQLADYAEHAGSQHASLLKGVIDGLHHGAARYTEVPVSTLDIYCETQGVTAIDLLKIDVEGFELHVLRGAKRMLSQGAIGVIQFEFNAMNVMGRSYMSDFFEILDDTHDLYRLLPHGLLRLERHNHWQNEQFVFQNILALRRS